jgi:trigger factor
MQVSVENTSGLGRRMTVQVPAEQIDQQVQNKLQQLARSVRLDGFRPGKVPLSVVKKRYEERVRAETASEIIASTYEQALQQENLRPVAAPSIEQMRNEPGAVLEYTASFEVYPEIEVPEVADMRIERPVVELTDDDVDAMLAKLRKQRVTWTKVERSAAAGDRLDIDFDGTIDGQPFTGGSAKNVPVELGSGSMIAGFEDQLLGAAPGERRTIEVTFPADYASSEVAGREARFEVAVHSIAEATLPELDDDFARSFGVGDGGLSKLRDEVRRNMERELEVAIKARLKQQVFDELLQRADIEIPASLIEGEIDALARNDSGAGSVEDKRERHRSEATRRVSLGLLIAEIFKRNELQVDPQRVRQVIETMAQSYEKPEEVVQWYYSNQEMLSGVQTLVMEDMVVDWLTEHANCETKTVGFDEIMQA